MKNGANVNNFLRNMMVLTENRSKRASSWDRTGGNRDFLTLKPGETATLAEIDGPAIVNHFYVTMGYMDWFHYRRAVIRMYWDGERSPSVEVPIGDFFGIPFAEPVFFRSLLISVNPGAHRSSTEGLNIYFPMPFAKHARIELFNDCEVELPNFWYHINYEEVDSLEPGLGYFHACWNREVQCEPAKFEKPVVEMSDIGIGANATGDENYVILDAKGRGNYAGCILQVHNLKPFWYGEGDDMIFIDGEKWPPSLHGTGTEEIFGGGACPTEAYFTPYCGYLLVEDPDHWAGRNAMYRFFVTDPIRFQKSIRVTIEHGHADNLGNDYASVAYWYQEEPHAKRPALPAGLKRIPRVAEAMSEAVETYKKAASKFAKVSAWDRLSESQRRKLGSIIGGGKRPFLNRDAAAASAKAGEYLDFVSKLKKA